MKRILVIGDDPEFTLFLNEELAARGLEMVRAAGGADALRQLRALPCDAVITDPRTPIEEDLALLGEMRRVRPGTRMVLLAPAATPRGVIEAMREQVFACFSHPFERDAVLAMAVRAAAEINWRGGIEVLSAHPDWLMLRVTCQLLDAERLVRFMTELRADLPGGERDALLTAFREILLNAMEHGAGFDPEKVVEVSAIRTRRAIVYHFRDPGPGFRLDSLPHAAISNSPADPLGHLQHRESQGLRSGGFGLLLTTKLVDEVIYNDKGNEVLLVKHTDH